jgi:hypothetical protein
MTRGFGRFLRRNTIGMLALFLALGGTTYAASTALIGKNTVASPQVVNGSLQTKDLSKKARIALKGNRGLRGLAGAQGAKGATGAQGVQGPPGPQIPLEAVHRIGAAGEPTFGTNWANFNAGFEAAGFYKDPWGIVHLVGDFGSAAGRSLTIFTLPAGYRPAVSERFMVYANGDTGPYGTMRVDSDGTVNCFSCGTSNVVINGITFRTG